MLGQNGQYLLMNYRSRDLQSLCQLLTVANGSAILRTLGESGHNAAISAIHSVISEFGMRLKEIAPDAFVVAPPAQCKSPSRVFEALEWKLLGLPISTGGATVPLLINLSPILGNKFSETGIKQLHDVDRFCVHLRFGAIAEEEFILHSGQSHEVCLALQGGRAFLALHPISRVNNRSIIMFHEALLRIDYGNGCPTSVGPMIAALERTGLIRVVDRTIINKCLDMLSDDPSLRLSCNVSAVSLTPDMWWMGVFDRLRTAPDIARRLTLEVTESSLPSDMIFALELLRALRSTGCSIAVDDFGVGIMGLDFIRVLRPAIIKISMRDVVAATVNRSSLEHLACLTALARNLVPHVIAEGVSSERVLMSVRRTSANWIQGDWVSGNKQEVYLMI